MTVAMNALSTGTKPIIGSTEARCAIHNRAAMPANTPESRKATAMTRFAGMPTRRSVC